MCTGRYTLALLITLAASGQASAQGADFEAGDLYLYSPTLTGTGPTDGAILRIDPVSGSALIFVDLTVSVTQAGALAYDPFRERLIIRGKQDSLATSTLWFVDAAGQVDDPGLGDDTPWYAFAPRGDGLVYFRDAGDGMEPWKYLDVGDNPKVLMNEAGTAAFQDYASEARAVVFDAGTNALFLASAPFTSCTGSGGLVVVRKVPLSADGARVSGEVGCAQFDVDSTDEKPVGWSRGPGGLLLLVVDTNGNGQAPRMRLIDPVSLAVTTFASNGAYTGAAATNAGAYSTVLGEAVILDTFNDLLRAYAPGETGEGGVLPGAGTFSAAGSSGEVATLIEIPSGSCAGGWVQYGEGLAGKGGFVPEISGAGCPGIGQLIVVGIDEVVGGASGLVAASPAAASLPFKGGTLWVQSFALTAGLGLGGAAGVGGAGSIDLAGLVPNDPGLPGSSLFLQGVFLDADAIKGVSLTNGLELQIG